MRNPEKGKKLYRAKDEEFTCLGCGKHTDLGYNDIFQTDAYTRFKIECVKESLCGKCLIDQKTQSDKEIELECKLEQTLNRENDHKNCANCTHYWSNYTNNCISDACQRVCSKHEWDKLERMERSYD